MAVVKEEAASSPPLESVGIMASLSNINKSSSSTTLPSMQDASHLQQQQQQQVGNCCASCRMPIRDRFIFSVIEQNFHQECVRCVDCLSSLNERCYAYEGKLYCRLDYWRRFGPKCSACQESIKPDEFVQRLRNNLVYHLSCFVCQDCKRHLQAGEQLHLVDERRLLCKRDFLITTSVDLKSSARDNQHPAARMASLDAQSSGEQTAVGQQQDENSNLQQLGRNHRQHQQQHHTHNHNHNHNHQNHNQLHLHNQHHNQHQHQHQLMASADLSCAASDDGDDSALLDDDPASSNGDQSPQLNLSEEAFAGQYAPLSKGGAHLKSSSASQDSSGQKLTGDEREANGTRRGPRTTIKPDQLDTLKRAFAQTPKPSRHVREQLANETHLNMRVIQVWFQNRRSKERRMKNSNGCLRRMNFARRRNHTDAALRKSAAAGVNTPTANSAPATSSPLGQQQSLMAAAGPNSRTAAPASGTQQQSAAGLKQDHSPLDTKDQQQQQLLSGSQQQAGNTPATNNRQSHNSPSEFGGSSSGGFTYFSDSSNQGDAFAINSGASAGQQQYLLGQDQQQTTLMTLESPSSANNGQRQQQQQYQTVKNDQNPPQAQQPIYSPQQHLMMPAAGQTQLGLGHRAPQQHHLGGGQMPPEPTLGLMGHPNQGAPVVQW